MAEKKTITDIRDMIVNFEDRHSELMTRMDNDYDLWALKKYTLDKWSDNITFNEPRIFADSVMQILEGAHLSIQVKRDDKDDKKETLAERFAFSAIGNGDDRLVSRLMPRLQQNLVFMGAIRGIMAGRVLVYKNKETGKLVIDVMPYDPRYLAYGTDAEGIVWSAYTTYRDPESIESEYGATFVAFRDETGRRRSECRVIEYWDRTDYYVFVDDGGIMRTTTLEEAYHETHKLGRPPVIVVPCGSTPLIVSGSDKYTHISNWGESIFAGGRSLFPELSKLLSIWMSLARKSHDPSGFVISPDSSIKIDSPYGKGEWVTLPTGSEVKPIQPPDIAHTVPQLFDYIAQAVQRSDFVWLKYGQLWKGQELSKVAISELKEGTDKTLTPLLTALNRFYRSMIQKLIDQFTYTSGEWKAKGVDSKDREFQEVFKPSDLKGAFDVNVEFVSITPDQEVANYTKAQLLKDGQWASNQYIRENVIKFPDVHGVDTDLLVQQAEEFSPKIKLRRVIDALVEQGKIEESQIITDELQKLVAQEQLALEQQKAQYQQTNMATQTQGQQVAMQMQPPQQQQAPPEETMVPPEGGGEVMPQVAASIRAARTVGGGI